MFRLYSYVYHLLLALFLLGVAVIAMTSSNTLRLPMLPWTGPELTQWLLWGSIAGLLSIVLAVTGIFRYLFPIWALIVLVIMVRGFLGARYPFPGPDAFRSALWLIAGAALAFLASLTLFRFRRVRRA
jgi:hypothetical protein